MICSVACYTANINFKMEMNIHCMDGSTVYRGYTADASPGKLFFQPRYTYLNHTSNKRLFPNFTVSCEFQRGMW